MARRVEAWRRLGEELPADRLAAITRVEPMTAVESLAAEILAGKVRGRVVVDVNG